MKGRKVHVRYFAVRSADGRYLGTLETVQDIAPLQKIEGERRLLDEALPV
ncbi:MAG TPA: PAS domain-containing protein [Candidatus Limnocylindria bacterium]|nr:PAS domain-containing protein [Candidatus Limnocylindria bacterium]